MNEALSQANKIARINDAFRTSFVCGNVVMTIGIANLPEGTKAQILSSVRNFTKFTEDNDPEGERDFGTFEVEGHTGFWKIDYYDKSLKSGSDDPSDLERTTRVLTIMLRSEY